MVTFSSRGLRRLAFVLCVVVGASAETPSGADAIEVAPVATVVRPSRAFTSTVRAGFTTLVRDEALLWATPFRSKRYALKTIVPLIAATGAALTVDKRLASALPNSRDQVRYSKGVSIAGTYYSLGGAAAAFVGIGAITGNARALETGLIAAEAVAHTESIAQMLKYAGGRERPDFGDAGGGRFWKRQQSFPSGHAMGTWAVATVISKQYHRNRIIRYGVYALPVLVSASRIGAQRHFLSDVVAGGSLGYLMGSWLYERHHDPALGGVAVRRRGISLKPSIGRDRRFGGVTFALSISR